MMDQWQNPDDLEALSSFLNGDVWDQIMNEAIYNQDPDSMELMDDILLRMSSAEFFLKHGEMNRHNNEVKQLVELTQAFL